MYFLIRKYLKFIKTRHTQKKKKNEGKKNNGLWLKTAEEENSAAN